MEPDPSVGVLVIAFPQHASFHTDLSQVLANLVAGRQR